MTDGLGRDPTLETRAEAAAVGGTLSARLLDDVLADHRTAGGRLSVIGICKNAGKTVTLNHLIRAAASRNIPLGLVSTGRDGEEQDAITELPKPHIWAPAGARIATARAALRAGSAGLTVLRELPITTPFGSMLIGRVETAGEVLLIGPGSARRMADVLGGLEELGARLCLVDGSFDRIAAAAPTVTGRVVLAAGAAYSASMAETVAQVRHLLDLFDLPQATPGVAEQAQVGLCQAPVCIFGGAGDVTPVPVLSGLGDPGPIVQAAQVAGPDPGIILQGALGDRLVMALLQARAPGFVVVDDPTRILVERNLWRRWRRQGGRAYVRHSVQLVAVTTNGYSPVGKGYDAAAFHAAVASIANRPVYDLITGRFSEST